MTKPPYEELEKQNIKLEKLIKESISDSDSHHNAIFSKMSQSFQVIELIYDTKGRAIDYYFRIVNLALEKLVAKTKDQLIDKRAKDLFGIVEYFWLDIYSQVVKTGESINFEKHNDELDRDYEVYAWKTEGNKVAVIFSDITDKKLQERESIKASKEKRKRTDKLHIANKDLALENEEKQKYNETVLGNLPADVAVFDKNHTYLYVNKNGISDLETRKWIIGKSDLDYCHSKGIDKSMAQERREYFNKAVETKQQIEWVDTYTKDSQIIYVLRKFYPVFIDEKLQYVLGYGIDVSELRKTQDELKQLKNNLEEKVKKRTLELSISNKKLRQTEERLEDFFDLSPSLMVITNPNGEVFKINKSCKTILGYTEKEIKKIGLWSLVHPEDIEKTNNIIKEQLKGRQILNFINRYRHKGGSYRTLEWQATTVIDGFTYAYAHDITERNKALVNLVYESNEKQKRADELKIANRELSYQNDEKHKRAEALTKANIKLLSQNIEKQKRADELKIADIKLAHESEEKGKRADELIIANVELEHQNEEKEKRADELKALNDTKDKLFSIIAHDLRSPFNGILGFSELLIENMEEYEMEESKKFLGIINSSAKSTLILLDNLLNWANFQTGQINFNPENLHFSSIIQEILGISILSAKIKNISLRYIQSEDIEVYADLNMLKTVLRNLISNAIKFTNSEGSIEVNAIQKNNCIEITISDDGVGMNEETLNKLFKLHTDVTVLGTAKENGSGLGLLLCKEFVEKHGGKIKVESEIKKGSTFKFTLPLSS